MPDIWLTNEDLRKMRKTGDLEYIERLRKKEKEREKADKLLPKYDPEYASKRKPFDFLNAKVAQKEWEAENNKWKKDEEKRANTYWKDVPTKSIFSSRDEPLPLDGKPAIIIDYDGLSPTEKKNFSKQYKPRELKYPNRTEMETQADVFWRFQNELPNSEEYSYLPSIGEADTTEEVETSRVSQEILMGVL